MRRLRVGCGTAAALLAGCLLAGCVVYLDNPPKQTFRGRVLLKQTSIPVADAFVLAHSRRRYLVLPPVPLDTFNIVKSTKSDAGGKFEITAGVNFPVRLSAHRELLHYGFVQGDTDVDQATDELVIRVWPPGERPRTQPATLPWAR